MQTLPLTETTRFQDKSHYLRDVIKESLSKVGKNIIHRIAIAKLDHSAGGFDDGHSDLPVLVGDGLHQGAYQGLRLHVEVLCGTGRLLVIRYSSVATTTPATFLWTLVNQSLLASTPPVVLALPMLQVSRWTCTHISQSWLPPVQTFSLTISTKQGLFFFFFPKS